LRPAQSSLPPQPSAARSRSRSRWPGRKPGLSAQFAIATGKPAGSAPHKITKGRVRAPKSGQHSCVTAGGAAGQHQRDIVAVLTAMANSNN